MAKPKARKKAETKPKPKAKAKAKAKAKPKAKPKAQPKPKPKAKPKPVHAAKTAIDKAAFRPGSLIEHDDGKYSVIYSDFPPLGAAATARGIEGGGYTWHGLVVHLMKKSAPKHLDRVSFDPEGSMFCAYGTDLEALGSVAMALARLEDPAVRDPLLATVDLSEYD